MAHYMITLDGNAYANNELFYNTVAGGERAFMRMLARKEVTGKVLFDQVVYPLSEEQKEKCLQGMPTLQDFDSVFKCLNIVPGSVIEQAQKGDCASYLKASVITVAPGTITEVYTYHRVSFFRVRDFKIGGKYRMLPKLATVRVGGSIYVALNAVNVRVKAPIIVTLQK